MTGAASDMRSRRTVGPLQTKDIAVNRNPGEDAPASRISTMAASDVRQNDHMKTPHRQGGLNTAEKDLAEEGQGEP